MLADLAFVTHEAYLGVVEALIDEAIRLNPGQVKPHQSKIVNPDLHDFILGKDVINGQEGNDVIVGDEAAFVTAVVNTKTDEDPEDILGISDALLKEIDRRLDGQADVRADALEEHIESDHGSKGHNDSKDDDQGGGHFEHRLPSKSEIELIPFDAQPDMFVGNDDIRGGDGDDLLVGDFGTVLAPIAMSQPQSSSDKRDLDKDVDHLIDDLGWILFPEHNGPDRHAHHHLDQHGDDDDGHYHNYLHHGHGDGDDGHHGYYHFDNDLDGLHDHRTHGQRQVHRRQRHA